MPPRVGWVSISACMRTVQSTLCPFAAKSEQRTSTGAAYRCLSVLSYTDVTAAYRARMPNQLRTNAIPHSWHSKECGFADTICGGTGILEAASSKTAVKSDLRCPSAAICNCALISTMMQCFRASNSSRATHRTSRSWSAPTLDDLAGKAKAKASAWV